MSKGLKALEDLMKDYYEMCQDLGNNDDQYQRCNLTSERAIIEKELKALEIIKEKNIAIKQLQMSPCLEAYCTLYRFLYHDVDWKGLQHLMPTQEEFDLLKEVLEDE